MEKEAEAWEVGVKEAIDQARGRVPVFDGAWFDVGAATGAVMFFPMFLSFTNAEWAGQPFWLTPWEALLVAQFFGWKRPDDTRVYRRLALWIARKNGKTELLAGLMILALMIDGEMGGEGYCIARDKDQASIPFKKMLDMVALAPGEMKEDFDALKTALVYTPLSASIKPLSGNASGKHGLSMSVLGGDEVHEWRDDELYVFVHQSSAARRQPCEFLASTAGKRGTYGEEFFETCREVLVDPQIDSELLVAIYAAGSDDDWQDEATWAKANPNLGISVKLDYLKAEARKAKMLPRLENDFRRYHLNQWVSQEVRWLPIEAWRACTAVPGDKARWATLRERLQGRRVFAGLDLAQVSDFNALVWIAEPEGDDDRWLWVPTFWICEASLETYSTRNREKLERWVKAGAIKVTAGDAADYEVIESDIIRDIHELSLDVPFEGFAIDRWNAMQITTRLVERGIPAKPFGQGFASMSGAMKRVEAQVLRGEIEHGSHPVLEWMAGSIQVKYDDAANLKPTRKNPDMKIDGIVAGIMATGAALGEEPEDDSYLDTDEVVMF